MGLPFTQPDAGVPTAKLKQFCWIRWAALIVACIVGWQFQDNLRLPWPCSHQEENGGVSWTPCSSTNSRLQCARVTVPLDHHNPVDDPRTISIALTRYTSDPSLTKKGSIFINPGGPGASGTGMVSGRGHLFSQMVQGHYDIVGFDPRGVNLTTPYISCFPSRLDEAASHFESSRLGGLNLPSTSLLNVTWGEHKISVIQADFERQFLLHSKRAESIARKCRERTGDEIAFMGTEAVVHDIDYISRLLEGSAPINYWGFSYGTVIGQYLIQIIPPNRLGKIIIDGVVDAAIWADYPHIAGMMGLEDIDQVFASFASACITAGPQNCALAESFDDSDHLLSAVDSLIDNLYYRPRPYFDALYPGVATAADIRQFLFTSAYKVENWPSVAIALNEALTRNNFTAIIEQVRPEMKNEFAGQNDTSFMAIFIITATDLKPYDDEHPPPSFNELAKIVFETIQTDSPRVADRFAGVMHAATWAKYAGLDPRRSRFGGPFGLPANTLSTPILILTNKYDPVTPLSHAQNAKERLGNNARLVQQTDGLGHCTISHVSHCTGNAIFNYFVKDTLPEADSTECKVDQQPFESLVEPASFDFAAKAWSELAKDWEHSSLGMF
ncbi:hypothetical protein DL96DRAFT_914986 [Flagelloscypha sp. PMI_526]|nr:hypothetical protein DL96DRAFT_914986 [Flagelloscypha sp. PMI_526]